MLKEQSFKNKELQTEIVTSVEVESFYKTCTLENGDLVIIDKNLAKERVRVCLNEMKRNQVVC